MRSQALKAGDSSEVTSQHCQKRKEWYFFPSFLACCLTPKWEHDCIGSPAYWLLFPVLASVFTASLVELLSSARIWHAAALPGALRPWPPHTRQPMGTKGSGQHRASAALPVCREGVLRTLIPNHCSQGLFCFPLQLQVQRTVIKKQTTPFSYHPSPHWKYNVAWGWSRNNQEVFNCSSNFSAALRERLQWLGSEAASYLLCLLQLQFQSKWSSWGTYSFLSTFGIPEPKEGAGSYLMFQRRELSMLGFLGHV